MSMMNKNTIKYIKKCTTDQLPEKRCIRSKPTYSCEFMLDYRTCLNPLPKKNTKIKEFTKITAKIEKKCAGKIIIGGILYKTICYTSLSRCGCWTKHIKHIKIPFSCFIDIDCKHSKDDFKIVDCKTVCNFSKVISSKNKCSKKAILVEKDIIKIIVKRKPCTNNCNYYFGNSVVDSDVCFAPAVNPKAATVSVDVDPKKFKVMLICCDLIVVSGVITKIVTFNDGTPTAKKDILVQVNVPATIEELERVDINKWEVTQAEICDGCYHFTCPNEDETLFQTLVAKYIISIEVSYKHKCQSEKL